MKLVLFCSPAANQRALAHRVSQYLPIEAIIVCRPVSHRPAETFKTIVRLARAAVSLPLRKAWRGMLAHYDRSFPSFPIEPALEVADINDPAVLKFVRSTRPELVLVSGTNLLKPPLIDAISEFGRVINLHTGISPYVRGGPNCTNWCLSTGRFELIGSTVMWIDAGIDSGHLIATEQAPLDRSESLTELHVKVMDHAHDLTLRCIKRLNAGMDVPSVEQSRLGPGQLFLARQWSVRAAARAVGNFYLGYRKPQSGPPPQLVAPD